MKNIIIIIFTVFSISNLFGQNLKKINYKIDNDNYQIEYEEILNIDELKLNSETIFPFYILDSINFRKLNNAALLINYLDVQRSKLKNNKEVTKKLEDEYLGIIKSQENRVLLYKDAYNQVNTINKSLIEQIDIAIDIGRKSGKRHKFNNVIFGVLGGLVAGITVGAVVSN